MASFIERLHRARAIFAAQREMEAHAKIDAQAEPEDDPWLPVLAQVRGQINKDGVEYITSRLLLDILNVKLLDRGRAYKRIAAIMSSLGWTAQRVFGVTGSSACLEQVRGYARDTRERRQQAPALRHSATKELENAGRAEMTEDFQDMSIGGEINATGLGANLSPTLPALRVEGAETQ